MVVMLISGALNTLLMKFMTMQKAVRRAVLLDSADLFDLLRIT